MVLRNNTIIIKNSKPLKCNFTKLDPFSAYFLGKTVSAYKIGAETVLIVPKTLGGD